MQQVDAPWSAISAALRIQPLSNSRRHFARRLHTEQLGFEFARQPSQCARWSRRCAILNTFGHVVSCSHCMHHGHLVQLLTASVKKKIALPDPIEATYARQSPALGRFVTCAFCVRGRHLQRRARVSRRCVCTGNVSSGSLLDRNGQSMLPWQKRGALSQSKKTPQWPRTCTKPSVCARCRRARRGDPA